MRRIEASTHVVFGVLVDDREAVSEPDAFVRQERLDDGPLTVGARVRRSVPHDGRRCVTLLEIVEFDPPRLLEERIEHHCHVSDRVTAGTERYILDADANATLLSLTSVRVLPWWRRLISWLCRGPAAGVGGDHLRRIEAIKHCAEQQPPDAEHS